ncbi:hypothetical protein T4D_9844, partial [Trichinella pseudospiralis]
LPQYRGTPGPRSGSRWSTVVTSSLQSLCKRL